MLLPRFDYQKPTSVAEALEILGEFKARAKVLAGGTDLLVNLKRGLIEPETVVHIGRIPGLDAIDKLEGGLRIGPLVTAAAMAESGPALGAAAMLGEAAGRLGTPLIRNRATLGGNLVSARPAADMSPPLMALGAKVVLAGPAGEREVTLDDYFTGPGQSVQEADELMTAIHVPAWGEAAGGCYLKLGARKTLEISLVNLAAFVRLDGDGQVAEARVVMGAVGPTPLRAPSAEEFLVGQRPAGEDDPLFAEAARKAAGDAKPIDDHRGSAEYRRAMVEVLTRRALTRAWSMARGD